MEAVYEMRTNLGCGAGEWKELGAREVVHVMKGEIGEEEVNEEWTSLGTGGGR